MAYETATKIIIAIAMALLAFGLSTTAASGQSGCTTVLIGLAPCLSYMTGNSSSPSSSCCSQLASVVQSQPECLCSALNGGASSLGIAINETRALALPGACNVQTPPVSRCTASGGGSPAESPSEAQSPPTSQSTAPPTETPSDSSNPSTPSTPAAGRDGSSSSNGSKSSSTTNGESSDGSPQSSPMSMRRSALVIASCVSTLASFF